jgi:lysophospholipase L1-like esterase
VLVTCQGSGGVVSRATAAGKGFMRSALVLFAITIAATIGLLEGGVGWIYADLGSTADNTSYFAERWRARYEGGRNSHGFREREVTTVPAGVKRIAVVGDSLICGQGIERDQRFTERLDQALGDDFEVLNFGISGASYPRLREIMGEAIEIARPDAVILQWFVNDVQPPGEWLPREKNLAGPFHRYMQPYSALYFVANRGFAQLQHSLGLVPAGDDYYEAFRDPQGERATAARERLEAVLDVAKAAGVPLGMVLWPDVTDRTPEGDFERHAFLFDQVLAVCADRQLSCLDLRPRLRALPADAGLVVNHFDAHPNALANEIAAEAMHGWLTNVIGLPTA